MDDDTDSPAAREDGRSGRRRLVAVFGVCALFLIAGYFLKAPCTGRPPVALGHLCYTDIPSLYSVDEVRSAFPYVNARLEMSEDPTTPPRLRDGGVEYPVLTGLFMWLSGRFSPDAGSYLAVSALMLAPFALAATALLYEMIGKRALLWAAAPALILYAFHNWDLLVVAASVGGIWAWGRGRFVLAGICFGLGSALKLFPALFLIPLYLERRSAGDPRTGLIAGVSGALALAGVNLPFILINAGGWWATYQYHQLRRPNRDSILGLLGEGSVSTFNLLSGAMLLVTATFVIHAGWRRTRAERGYPFVQVCGALLVAFMLWSKVQSPQHTLWILPFFALLHVPLRWWIAYALADLMVYLGFFGERSPLFSFDFRYYATNGGVALRAFLLALLLIVFLDAPAARRKRRPAPGSTTSAPAG